MRSRLFFVTALVMALVLLTSSALAQKLADYSKPKGYFPNVVGPYSAREVPQPNFANAPRIEQLTQGGRLMLSLNDAVALALENNLDLAIARYNLNIADTDILRAKAGSSVRGVATGVVQNTPGGGVGGFGTGATGAGAGGTTTAAGGAATGTSGLVQSTLGAGPPIDSFDPALTSTMQIERSVTPQSTNFITGVNTLNQNTGTANFGYSQGFPTGTLMGLSFNNQRATTNSLRSDLNPILSSSFRLTVRQHLLSGFGLAPNSRFIRIARNNREISDVSFRLQVISTVTQIQNIYWDLVNAYEDVKVKERSLALAQKTLSDNRKQVEIGTLAPIEITRADAEVSARQQDLIVSQTNLQLQQLLTKNALTRNMTDPIAAAPVIPTDTMRMPQVEPVVPTQELINDALQHRAELSQSRIDLTNRDINKKAARNGLMPTVDLFGFYGGSGLGGRQNPLCPTCVIASPVTGYGDVFSDLFNSSSPDKGVGLSVNIPIRNRSSQADQVRADLEYRQAQMHLQQLENQIRIEVRNAQFALQQNRARVEAAQKGVQLAHESLDAEQKKYALGASTNFLVLQAQRDETQAESNLVNAMAAYEKSRVELDRATGMTLAHTNIDLGDAESGNVSKLPNVPGVAPRPDTTPTQQQIVPQAQQQAPPPPGK